MKEKKKKSNSRLGMMTTDDGVLKLHSLRWNETTAKAIALGCTICHYFYLPSLAVLLFVPCLIRLRALYISTIKQKKKNSQQIFNISPINMFLFRLNVVNNSATISCSLFPPRLRDFTKLIYFHQFVYCVVGRPLACCCFFSRISLALFY